MIFAIAGYMLSAAKSTPGWSLVHRGLSDALKTGRRGTYRPAGGANVAGVFFRLASSSFLGKLFSKVAQSVGITAIAEFFLPDQIINLFDLGPTPSSFGPTAPPPPLVIPAGMGPVGPGVALMTTDSAMPPGLEGTVIRQWNANGTPFVRLLDGRLGARKKNGTWTFWRPKRPIVLYASGASKLTTLLKADRAVDKQLKRLEKAMRHRGIIKPRRRTTVSVSRTPTMIQESGPGGVMVDK